MKKLTKITSLPIVVAIMLMQGIELPPEVPREEAESIVNMLQNSDGTSENSR